MSEKVDLEKLILESAKLESTEVIDSELKLTDNIIQDFAPEIAYLYQFREDEAEEQQIKTGRLHENRILGIFLKCYLKGKDKITTGDVEEEYKKYFKDIARSTTSTYLNMLKKESTLYTERDGRLVYYLFYKKPPIGLKPFWFTRIFCIVPTYFDRAMFFSKLYENAENYVQEFANNNGIEEGDILITNFKFITGLIILNIFKNRSSKCKYCQFSKREFYNKIEELIDVAIKDRSDVLPEDLTEDLIEKFSELPIFNGADIKGEDIKKDVVRQLLKSAIMFKKDLNFQIMVAARRKDIRLKQKIDIEIENINLIN